MPKIQIDLSEEEDRKVDTYRALKGLDNKAEAIKQIIEKFEVKGFK